MSARISGAMPQILISEPSVTNSSSRRQEATLETESPNWQTSVSQTFSGATQANYGSMRAYQLNAVFDRAIITEDRDDGLQTPPRETGADAGFTGLSAAEANLDPAGEERPVFITQYKNSTYNPENPIRLGEGILSEGPDGDLNCGPTSAAMALDVIGLQIAGTPQETIDYIRNNSGDLDGEMSLDSVATGINAVDGAHAERRNGWSELDAALDAGNTIVLGGNIWSSPNTDTEGDNLGWIGNFPPHGSPGGYSSDTSGAHYIAILGRGVNSDNEVVYTVADPLSSGGAVELTRDQLARFCDPSATDLANGAPVATDSDLNDGTDDVVNFLVVSGSAEAE